MELFGPSNYDASAPGAHPGRLYNLWADRVEAGGRTRRLLRAHAGLDAYADFGTLFVRALFERDGTLFAVVNDALYRVDMAVPSRLAAVSAEGTADLGRNGDKVTMAVGGVYHVWDGATLATPAVGAFPEVASVSYLAGRTILVEKGGSRFCWSDVADPLTLNALNVATAEGRDDPLERGIVAGGYLYLFGTRSIEVWAPDGAGVDAFSRLPGMVVERGLFGFRLAVRVEGAIFFIGDDRIAYFVTGRELQPVSHAGVNAALKFGKPESCFYWEDRGHKFVAIAFRDRPAWVYDIAAAEWSERGEGDFGPWRARHSARLGDSWIVGGDDGRLFRLRGVQDAGVEMFRSATSYPIYNDGNWFTLAEAEFFVSGGFVEPSQIMLETSHDRVRFVNARTLDLPELGDFGHRVMARSLGRARDMTLRVTITDPVDVPLFADARLRLA